MKLLIMICVTIAAFFQYIFSPFLPERQERTDWMENGVYKGFFYGTDAPERTMKKLLEAAEAGDHSYIYETFSQRIQKAYSDQLEANIPELLEFLDSRITDWEAADESHSRNNGTVSRVMSFNLSTEDITYTCEVHDYMVDGKSGGIDAGFHHIFIWPEDFDNRNLRRCLTDAAVRIVYQTDETEIMERLTELSEAENIDGLYELFSQEIQDNTEELPEQIGELFGFLNDSVTHWEPYVQTQTVETHQFGTASEEELFFYLYTDAGDYLCIFRNVTSDTCHQTAFGLSSISVFPAPPDDWEVLLDNPWYGETCDKSSEAAGIFLAYMA